MPLKEVFSKMRSILRGNGSAYIASSQPQRSLSRLHYVLRMTAYSVSSTLDINYFLRALTVHIITLYSQTHTAHSVALDYMQYWEWESNSGEYWNTGELCTPCQLGILMAENITLLVGESKPS